MWFLVAALFVGLVGAFLLLQPKPKIENARASTLHDLNFPRSQEGSPNPLILGRVRTKGPNTGWIGDFKAKPIKKKQKTGMFSSKKVIVGYEYFVGIQLLLGIGPCTLHKIWADKDELWSGTANADGQALVINKPKLFGGKEKGGGFVGTIRFYTGGFVQGINAYLESKIGVGLVPGYRGTTHIVLEHCNIGEQNSLRPLSFELSRYTNGLGLAGGIEKVGDDMNPMELLFQVFTLKWGGLDVTPDLIDLDSWKAAAATLFAEGNGMSLIVSTPNQGKDIANEVMRQAEAIMFNDPETGKIVMKLIRNDYDVDDLPVFDETNVLGVRSFASKLWEDTINQIRVTYTNRDKKYETGSAMVQDMANINAQGRIRSSTLSYPGVTNGELALKMATRDLTQSSVPLLSATLEMNREGANLRPGDVFLWAWSAYKLDRVVMRVKSFDLGALNDNRIAINCSQDEFAIDETIFTAPVSGGSNPTTPTDIAVASPNAFATEAPLFFANAAGIALGATQSLILVSAEAPAGSDEYDVYTSNNTVDYALSEENVVYAAKGTLNTAVTASANLATGVLANLTITVDATDLDAFSAAQVAQGYGMLLIDAELLAYQGLVDNGNGTITVSTVWRALLDTIPVAHAIGANVYFVEGDSVIDDAFNYTDTIRVKVAPKTFDDALDVAAAPYVAVTLNKRAARPLKPANVKFDAGAAFAPPGVGTGSKTVTWANRDRNSLTVRNITDATNEYEAGQQTVFRYRKNGGAWVAATIAPGLTTYTFDAAAAGGDTVDYEIYSTFNGLDSISKWKFTAGAAAGAGDAPPSAGGTGANPADATTTYVAPEDSISLIFPFGETIGTYPIDLPITFDLTIPAGLTGTNVDHRVNPTAVATFTLKKNNVAVGTVAIAIAGTYTLTAAAQINLVKGDTLTCEPPAAADGTLKGVTVAVAAYRKKVV